MNENLPAPGSISPFERIRRTNAADAEFWSSRDFAGVPEKYRTLIPEHVKDYVSLNQFAA